MTATIAVSKVRMEDGTVKHIASASRDLILKGQRYELLYEYPCPEDDFPLFCRDFDPTKSSGPSIAVANLKKPINSHHTCPPPPQACPVCQPRYYLRQGSHNILNAPNAVRLDSTGSPPITQNLPLEREPGETIIDSKLTAYETIKVCLHGCTVEQLLDLVGGIRSMLERRRDNLLSRKAQLEKQIGDVDTDLDAALTAILSIK